MSTGFKSGVLDHNAIYEELKKRGTVMPRSEDQPGSHQFQHCAWCRLDAQCGINRSCHLQKNSSL